MFAVLDKLRYIKEENIILKYPYDVIDQEKNYFIKEKLISKLSHFKMIFGDKRSLNNDGIYMLYYNINFDKFYNAKLSEDEISENIYSEYIKLSELEKKRFIKNYNINVKNITAEIIDFNALKYLPSRMSYLTICQTQEIEDKIEDSQSIKRKPTQELHQTNNKHIKLSEEEIEISKSIDLTIENNVEADDYTFNENENRNLCFDCAEFSDYF